MSNPMNTSSTPARSADGAANDRLAAQPGAGPRSSTSTVPPPIRERRDRYIDALRALALVRIVTYHQFGWHWLPLAYPSIGILFALAGALVARSLTRARGNYWTVLARRTRRLLPPLWMFGLVLIPVMVLHGWTATTAGGGDPLRHWRLMFFWLLPLADPPGSDWGYDFVLPLWYIRCYLWLLLLSPALLFLFRRWPKRLIAVPLAIVAASTFGIIDLSNGRGAGAVLDVGIYGACWMLGFAHHDGSIRTIRTSIIVPIGVVLLAGGLTWAITHQTDTGWDIDNIPPAATLYSLGAVLLLLRYYPSLEWMSRIPALDKTLMMISSRAMTIFLWHNLAIFLAVPVLDSNRRHRAGRQRHAGRKPRSIRHRLASHDRGDLPVRMGRGSGRPAPTKDQPVAPNRTRNRTHALPGRRPTARPHASTQPSDTPGLRRHHSSRPCHRPAAVAVESTAAPQHGNLYRQARAPLSRCDQYAEPTPAIRAHDQ